MNRIIKVYLKNVFTQKGFYICLLINTILSVALPFMLGALTQTGEKMTVASVVLTALSSGEGIIETIFITIFVCNDFSEGATKNFIARGYTRRQLLTAKFFVSVISTMVFLLVNIVGTFVFYSKNGMGFDSSIILYVIGSLAVLFANVGLYVVISNTVEKLGIAIAINLILPNVVSLLFPAISAITKSDVNFSNYWISGLTGLMSYTPTIKEMLLVVGLSFAYLIILFEISNYIIKKKEVK